MCAAQERLNQLNRVFTLAGVFILFVSTAAVFILFAEFILFFSTSAVFILFAEFVLFVSTSVEFILFVSNTNRDGPMVLLWSISPSRLGLD